MSQLPTQRVVLFPKAGKSQGGLLGDDHAGNIFNLGIAVSVPPLNREVFREQVIFIYRNVFKTAENMKLYGSYILLNELCQSVKRVQITIYGWSKMAKQGGGLETKSGTLALGLKSAVNLPIPSDDSAPMALQAGSLFALH